MNDELELESQEKISFSVWKKIFKKPVSPIILIIFSGALGVMLYGV